MKRSCLGLSTALFSTCLYAQNAGLSGTVTDPARAVVVGARVTATRVENGIIGRTSAKVTAHGYQVSEPAGQDSCESQSRQPASTVRSHKVTFGNDANPRQCDGPLRHSARWWRRSPGLG